MTRSLITMALLAAGLAAHRPALAQQPKLQVQLSVADEDGIVDLQKPVLFTASVSNSDDLTVDATVTWSVKTLAFDAPENQTQHISLEGMQKQQLRYRISIPAAGFAEVVCDVLPKGAKKPQTYRKRIGADVDSLNGISTKQNDFDSFWIEAIRDLRKVEPRYQVVEQPNEEGNTNLYLVTMRSIGNVRVRGWLEVPKTAGPHPVVIRVPGYGQNMRPVNKWQDMIVFSFNPRGHGNSTDDVPGKPVDYWIRGLDDKSTYYYRGAYLDCVRAVDFVCSRPDVDQTRIAIWGGSQGGGFAFASAALDSRIDFCAADIPFLCDWVNYFKLTDWPEMNDWVAAKKQRTWPSTLTTLSYFDTMNLADRIKCPTVMGVGLQDQVCPPTTDFNTFNLIPAKKSYKIYDEKGHGLGSEHWSWVWKQIRSEFKLTTKE